jgi:hypothetical protein
MSAAFDTSLLRTSFHSGRIKFLALRLSDADETKKLQSYKEIAPESFIQDAQQVSS